MHRFAARLREILIDQAAVRPWPVRVAWNPERCNRGARKVASARDWDGIAASSKPENKVSLGFVEGLNNKIRVLQRRACGLRDEEYLRLKVLTCMPPKL